MRHFILCADAVLVAGALAEAGVIGWNSAVDGDGARVMSQTSSWSSASPDSYNLPPVPVKGDFTTNTDLDPTLWIVENVDYYTNLTWTDCHIAIDMNNAFSVVGAVTSPDRTWTVTAPAFSLQKLNQTAGTLGTVGHVDFVAGPPIAVGGKGRFSIIPKSICGLLLLGFVGLVLVYRR